MGALDTLLTILAFGQEAPAEEPAPYAVPVRETEISSGDTGARQMVTVMRQEAHAALRNPLTIQAAEAIMAPGLSAAVQVGYLRDWLSRHIQFMPDPYGVELLRTPDYLLELIRTKGKARGDCDDVATLAASLGMAAGIPARFVLYSFGDNLPLSHVFCELYTMCQGWMELDVTRPAQMAPDVKVARAETHEV